MTESSDIVKGVRGAIDCRIRCSYLWFVETDGTLWAMGINNYGQLGDGTTTNLSTPVQVASDVVQVATGKGFSLFLQNIVNAMVAVIA